MVDEDADGSWLVPLPARVQMVSHVRGSMLVASREQVRVMGAFERYTAELAPDSKLELGEVIAASWVPIGLAHAHYAALDRLNMDPQAIEQAVSVVASKLSGIFLGTTAQAARVAGVTPWAGARILGATWRRLFKGGAPALKRVGPKEGLVVAAGNPLLMHRYHRIGLRVHVARAAELFSQRSLAREISYEETSHTLTVRLQWV
jgi:hypothetical protein